MLLRRPRVRLTGWGLVALMGIGLLALASPRPAQSQPRSQAESNLRMAAQVWGLAKYRHPRVTACLVDWDAALLQRLPAIESASTDAARDALLLELVASAGAISDVEPTAETPAWIRDEALEARLRLKLAALAAQSPSRQCYVRESAVGNSDFSVDSGLLGSSLTRPVKILAAFRFWNAVEYFSPYRSDIGRDWAGVLAEHVLPIADSSTLQDYTFALRRFTAEINDGHSFLDSASVAISPFQLPPFRVKRIGERFIVDRALAQAGPVHVGDELLIVNGRPFSALIEERRTLGSGSNPAARELQAITEAASAFNPGNSAFEFARADGSRYSAVLPVNGSHYQPLLEGGAPAFRTETLDQCRMGVINMSRLQVSDVDAALASLSSTDAIVFDLRGYPNGVIYELMDRVLPEQRFLAAFDRPDVLDPGNFIREELYFGGGRFNGYRGRFLLLLDEQSVSQTEFTAMLLQASDNSISFGSQTAGADGDITPVSLPGGVQNYFSGLGISYPDGRATQRVGIVPDVHVYPTVAGLRSGRDEVLEAALDCRWLTQTPERRSPVTGMYGDPTRSGEGLELHRVEGGFAVIHYGYDSDGKSDWLLGSAQPTPGDDFAGGLNRFSTTAAPSSAGELRLNRHVGAYRPACAIADQTRIDARVSFDARIDGKALTQCLDPVFASSGSPLSGAWAGAESDRGWGLGVHRKADTLAVTLYAYDTAGRPRWALGAAPIAADGSAILAMQTFSGFCRECPSQSLGVRNAGSIELQLNEDGSGIATIDVEIDPGSFWRRDSVPITRLSLPN